MSTKSLWICLVASVQVAAGGGLRGQVYSRTRVEESFIGAQHWNESGWYADTGFKQHYDGYFCLCSCNNSEEGVFCSGAGMHPDGETQVAKFLGVFSEDKTGGWVGDLVAYNNTNPFSDHFTMEQPGGASNYTGVSQSLGGASFVWRGYMSGVDCQFKDKCEVPCSGTPQFDEWVHSCS